MRKTDLLRELLRWHRHRLTREAVDLPTRLRIRARDHLSQDDLALLVRVSVRTISDLESGRGRPDPALLDRIADALRMYPDERRVLHELALGHPPGLDAYETEPDPALEGLVRQIPSPAVAIDAVMNIHTRNDAFATWIADLTPGSALGNLAVWVCLEPHAQHVLVEWSTVAKRILSRLRGVAARLPDDPQVSQVLERVRASAVVNDIWEEDSGRYYDPFAIRCSLRRPGSDGSNPLNDSQRRVAVKLVALSGPRLNDERRMVTFLFDDPKQIGDVGPGGCSGCER